MSASKSESPVRDLIMEMTSASFERSDLDAKALMMVRFAALASIDAPPISYLVNLGAGAEVGLEAEDVRQVLIGIAPIVGTARVAAAAGNMARAYGLAIAVADADLEKQSS
jgi:hypothetical protein